MRKICAAAVGQAVAASLDAFEPAVDVALQDFGRIGHRRLEIARAARCARESPRAIERLLAVCGHYGTARATAERRIAQALPMLIDNSRASFRIASRAPWRRLYDHFDMTPGRYRNEPKAEKTAQLFHSRITFAPTAPARSADREPYVVACRQPVDGLQQKFEGKGELQFGDDDGNRFTLVERDDIAPADLPLHLEAQAFEECFDRQVEAGFHLNPGFWGKLCLIRRSFTAATNWPLPLPV